MKQILFIDLTGSSFVGADEAILKKYFRIVSFHFRYRKGFRLVPELIREMLFVLHRIWFSDVVFVWFSDFHAVIPAIAGRLFNRKVIIVIGGYDAANEKALHYGAKTKLLSRVSSVITVKLATHLLPVTRFTYGNLMKNFGKKLAKKSTVIYNGYQNIFTCPEEEKRKNNVVTVCLAESVNTVILKGVDFYVNVARAMPGVTFYVVGVTKDASRFLQNMIPENVILIGKIPQQELKEILCSSKVICQFSRFEAFGVALLEGISAGCYPVGYHFGGTSEILTDNLGILIDELDIEKGVKAVSEALSKTRMDILPIMKSVEERFSMTVREQNLIGFLESV